MVAGHLRKQNGKDQPDDHIGQERLHIVPCLLCNISLHDGCHPRRVPSGHRVQRIGKACEHGAHRHTGQDDPQGAQSSFP